MKIKIERASKTWKIPCKNARCVEANNREFEIEINSLEELMELVDEVEDIIINKDKSITIYDDYVE